MRSRRWKFAASLSLLLCLSASIAVGGFAADASVAEQYGPGGGGGRPPQSDGYKPSGAVWDSDGHCYYPGSWTTVSEATCSSKEKQVRYCAYMEWDEWSRTYKRCNWADYREVGDVNPNKHVNTEIRDKKEATCTEEGYTGDLYCKDCGNLVKKGETIPKTDHKWDKGKVTTKPTCTDAGVKTYTCTVCKTTKPETIKATGHKWKKDETVAPTCTGQGYTLYVCQNDGSHTDKRDYKKALGHDWDDWKVTKEATCTETGVKTRTCKRDSSHTDTETIDATGHNYTEKVVPPTCESDGYTIFTCSNSNCDYIYTGNVTEKLGHDYQLKDHKDATCTEAGYNYYECSRDALHHYTEPIPATDHMYGKEVVEPTCTEEGYTKYTCVYCSDSYTTDKVPALGHAEVVISGQEPTCEEDGWTESSYCKRCQATLKAKETIPALGHDWDNGVVTTQATCTKDGVKTYTCKRDSSHTYTEAIPATGHMYGKEVVEPTCTEEGYTKYTCVYCSDSYTTDKVPALGHEEVVISGQNPTCEAEGWTESSYCKRCQAILKAKEIIPAQGHDPIAVPGKEPTCTETGLTEGSKCQRCEKTLTAQETIPALGHDWNTTSTGVDNCVNVSFRHENETVTLCPICGVQNGTQRLNKVTLYTAHAKLVVLRGVLENGMEAMTVAFYEPGISSVTACQRCGAVRDSFSSGASLPQAAENAHFTVDASLVDGYTVMLVQADGTETVLTPGISDGKAIFDVDMKGQGARLLHLVPTTAA